LKTITRSFFHGQTFFGEKEQNWTFGPDTDLAITASKMRRAPRQGPVGNHPSAETPPMHFGAESTQRHDNWLPTSPYEGSIVH